MVNYPTDVQKARAGRLFVGGTPGPRGWLQKNPSRLTALLRLSHLDNRSFAVIRLCHTPRWKSWERLLREFRTRKFLWTTPCASRAGTSPRGTPLPQAGWREIGTPGRMPRKFGYRGLMCEPRSWCRFWDTRLVLLPPRAVSCSVCHSAILNGFRKACTNDLCLSSGVLGHFTGIERAIVSVAHTLRSR